MNGLLDLCQHIAAFKEGGLEFKASMESFKQFLAGAGERNAILKRCATYRRWLGLDMGRQKRPLKIAAKPWERGSAWRGLSSIRNPPGT